MAFMTFHSVGNVIIPTDELHHFSEGWLKTTNLVVGRLARKRRKFRHKTFTFDGMDIYLGDNIGYVLNDITIDIPSYQLVLYIYIDIHIRFRKCHWKVAWRVGGMASLKTTASAEALPKAEAKGENAAGTDVSCKAYVWPCWKSSEVQRGWGMWSLMKRSGS